MSYADSLLASGRAHPSAASTSTGSCCVWTARFAILALIAGPRPAHPAGVHGRRDLANGVVRPGGGHPRRCCSSSAALIVLGWAYLRYRNEEYVITSRRIIHAEGVINKKSSDSSLEKINDAVLTQSIFGRIFGFGDLDVLTASESGIERLRMLRRRAGLQEGDARGEARAGDWSSRGR